LPAPAAPASASATALSATSIRVAWTDESTSEQGFKVERSTDGSNWQIVGYAVANASAWTNSNLAAGTTYSYRVFAYDGTATSAYSNVATASTLVPPAAPSDATAAALSATSIRVTWTDNTTTEQGFKVERSLDGVAWQVAGYATANGTSWTNYSLGAGTTYHYRVFAYDGPAASNLSNTTMATTFGPPAAPSGVTATPLSATSARISWTDNATVARRAHRTYGFAGQIRRDSGANRRSRGDERRAKAPQ
jgi:titin